MAETLYIGAYWGDREDTLEDCCEHLASTLRRLAQVSPLFDGWASRSRGQPGLINPERATNSDAKEALAGGAARRDSDATRIRELGWSWSAWNGRREDPAVVSVNCGGRTSLTGVSNSFLLELPSPGTVLADRCYEATVLLSLISLVSEKWQPSFAVVTSDRLRSLLPTRPLYPFVGWATYLADLRTAGSLPIGIDERRLGDGVLLSFHGPPSGLEKDAVEGLQDILDRAGALRAIVPNQGRASR